MRVDNITTVAGDTGFVQQTWIAAGTIQAVGLSATASAGSTAPTLATTTQQNQVYYKQLGAKTYQVAGTYQAASATGATAGTGDYLFTLPAGLEFDTTIQLQNNFQGGVQTSDWWFYSNHLPGSEGALAIVGLNGSILLWMVPWDATRYRIITRNNTDGAVRSMGGNYFPVNQANFQFRWTFTFQTP